MISLCTTCKGRLWQLEQTIAHNLSATKCGEIEMVLLDYYCPNNLLDFLTDLFSGHLADGRLKYYRLTEDRFFDMSHAKNTVHRLSTGNILFNLDADNFVGSVIPELMNLRPLEMLVNKRRKNGGFDGRPGRIGMHRSTFELLRGYDETIEGMGCDDGDIMTRAKHTLQTIRLIESNDATVPIQNTLKHRVEHVADKNCFQINMAKQRQQNPRRRVNPKGYGQATVRDHLGNIIHLE